MKINKLYIILIFIALASCSEDYKYDELDFNIYSGVSRANSYEQFGDFPFQIVTEERLNTTDSSGVVQTALRLQSPYNIIANSNGKILRINNTSVDKEFQIDDNSIVATGMTADRNSNIYFISSDDNLYSLDVELNLRWKIALDIEKSDFLSFSDLLSTRDGIFVAANSGELIKYDFDGKELWRYKSSISIGKTFSADLLDNLYIPLTKNQFGVSDSLLCLDKSGAIKWQIGLKDTRILSSSAYKDDKIFVAGAIDHEDSKSGVVYAIDKDGKEIWRNETLIPARFVSIDSDGNCFVSCITMGVGEIQTGIFAFDKNGKQTWKIYIGAASVSPLVISPKFIAFSGFTGGGAGMYFLRKSDGLLVKFHSLSNYLPLYLQPIVLDDGTIRLYGSTKLMFVKFTQTFLDKFF